MGDLSDEDLDFAALMEGLGGEDLASQLKAAASDELKPSDDRAMLVQNVATIGQLRDLVEAYFHVLDHECAQGAAVLIDWAETAVARAVPFLQWLDSADWSDLRPDEQGDEGADGSIEAGDDGTVEMGGESDDVQD